MAGIIADINVDLNAFSYVVRKANSFAAQLRDVWYKGSTEVDAFTTKVLMLCVKHDQWNNQLHRFGMTEDEYCKSLVLTKEDKEIKNAEDEYCESLSRQVFCEYLAKQAAETLDKEDKYVERIQRLAKQATEILEKEEKYVKGIQRGGFLKFRIRRKTFPEKLISIVDLLVEVVDTRLQRLETRVADLEWLQNSPNYIHYVPVSPVSGNFDKVRNGLEIQRVVLKQLEFLNAVGENPEIKLSEVTQASRENPLRPKLPWTKGEVLGKGSFGTVYAALDGDGMWFAVKEVSIVEQDKEALYCVAQLQQADGKLYIFLELASRGSLAAVYKGIKLLESHIGAYTRQILKGLKYLHDRSILHRDIKCANILVDTKGICKLADFGMAKQMSSLAQQKSCKGSAFWMAPEVINHKMSYGLPADIWSLGCSILEMATRAPPFSDMEWFQVLLKVGKGTAPPIPESLSDAAKDFLKICFEINPTKRATATQLLEHPFILQAGC